MNAHGVDFDNDSLLESTHFIQDETTDILLKHCLCFLKLHGATQKQIQQCLALHRKVLKEGSSNLERNNIAQPVYEGLDTTQHGYATPIQCQYPWPYNPSLKPQEVARISVFGSLVVPETNQYQIPTNPTVVPQNGNRPSQDARQRTPMTPTRNTSASAQTAINASSQ